MPLPTITQTEWYAADIAARAADQALRQADLDFRQTQATAYASVNALSTAAQNARAVAEQAVATMGGQQAQAQLAMVAALNAPAPAPSDAALLLSFMQVHTGRGVAGATAAAFAKNDLAAYKALTYKPPSAPT